MLIDTPMGTVSKKYRRGADFSVEITTSEPPT
jgi:hypothetical protein